ncbi:glycine zipper 2TM domain-containing protein [Stenotrophomonas sp. Iso1]|uniref:glycine zipper 2TM domain-containing protein n=1 Tax=Stenotrophomonas sp. Iso1 TaxID=2977283 RepID=UPI0022B7CEF6|nr:glycine zipper 2TM domain-containing protein [Stenotrophomonas sp. Iso1]
MRTFHSKLATTFVGLGMLFAASAQAQTYGPRDEGRRFNDGSRVECRKVEVANNARDQNRVAGTATGAVVGGLLGNQVGKGNGRKVATAAGAVAGGLVGRNVQGRNQERNGQRVIETRCERVYR